MSFKFKFIREIENARTRNNSEEKERKKKRTDPPYFPSSGLCRQRENFNVPAAQSLKGWLPSETVSRWRLYDCKYWAFINTCVCLFYFRMLKANYISEVGMVRAPSKDLKEHQESIVQTIITIINSLHFIGSRGFETFAKVSERRKKNSLQRREYINVICFENLLNYWKLCEINTI